MGAGSVAKNFGDCREAIKTREILMQDVVILSGARTAIGTFGGSLAGTPPIKLGSIVAKAARIDSQA